MTMATDYRSMFDRDYLGAWDLPAGRDVVVTIAKVEAGTLTSQGNRKTRKPVIHFEGKEKGFALNKTNGKAIANMYGPKVESWIGKRIALYATTTTFGSETVECIRVRPTVPKQATKPNGKAADSEPEQPAIDDGAVAPEDEPS